MLELADGEGEGQRWVYAPDAPSGCVVVSDIDDTVLYTGVANKLMMLWRLFYTGAEARVPFPGVADLYRALHVGASGFEANPMLYVSRGPWSVRPIIEAFFQAHEIPVRPILFLRDWGLSLQHPLPRKSTHHKRDLIERMLAIYPDRPFVLIGDSGQRDPEVYAELARSRPGRIQMAYIRGVSRKEARVEEIRALARPIRTTGTELVVVPGSLEMARDAARRGLVGAHVPVRLAEKLGADDDAHR